MLQRKILIIPLILMVVGGILIAAALFSNFGSPYLLPYLLRSIGEVLIGIGVFVVIRRIIRASPQKRASLLKIAFGLSLLILFGLFVSRLSFLDIGNWLILVIGAYFFSTATGGKV